jgi:hypothetical protein
MAKCEARQMQMVTLINRIESWETVVELLHTFLLTVGTAGMRQRYRERENTIGSKRCWLKIVE